MASVELDSAGKFPLDIESTRLAELVTELQSPIMSKEYASCKHQSIMIVGVKLLLSGKVTYRRSSTALGV